MLNQHGKDFIQIIEHIRPSKHTYEVFSDWLIMASASLYNVWKKDPAIEEEYLQIANQYKKEELDKHCELLAITVNALEESEQDFLGEIFSTIEMSNKRTGQFFTPYHISYMMAKMVIGEKELPKDHICKISDPCCGAGGLLIAGAQVMKERKLNFQSDALFVGQDIDARCVRMAFIQLNLLGVSAILICGNTLTFETYWQRETIVYHITGMEFRLKMEEIRNKNREQESPPSPAQKEKESMEIKFPPRKELVQGELF
jgi:type I restriction-modification system DNA methylase subunit